MNAKQIKEQEAEDCLKREVNDCVHYNAAKRGDKFWTWQVLGWDARVVVSV